MNGSPMKIELVDNIQIKPIHVNTHRRTAYLFIYIASLFRFHIWYISHFHYYGHSITLFKFVLEYENNFLGLFFTFSFLLCWYSLARNDLDLIFIFNRINRYIQEPRVPDYLTFWGFYCPTPERTFSSSFHNTWNDLEKIRKDFPFEKKKI